MLLEEEVQRRLCSQKATLALAESCSGGAIAARLVTVPQCSFYFLGCVVAYSNQAKKKLLGVSEETSNSQGAVSEETAIEMARGALRCFHSHFSLAVTGIAGPTGGTPEKPIGTVCFAFCGRGGKEAVYTTFFQEKRKVFIQQVVDSGLAYLLKNIT